MAADHVSENALLHQCLIHSLIVTPLCHAKSHYGKFKPVMQAEHKLNNYNMTADFYFQEKVYEPFSLSILQDVTG